MPKVNPEILKWARESAGLTEEEAAKKLAIKDTQSMNSIVHLSSLESGDTEPSRSLLNKMAKQYHRPLLTFYMKEIPKRGYRGEDFRTLPDDIDIKENALVDALIRDIRTRQELVRAIIQDDEESERIKFIGSTTIEEGKQTTIQIILSSTQFDLNQFRKQPSSAGAFTYLRNCTEKAGIFVLLIGNLGSYHTDIDLEGFRGFALADDLAPFIVINNADSKSAWSFTLIHELTHLVLGQIGISNNLYGKKIEKFCNDVAAEILLPDNDIDQRNINTDMPFDKLKSEIAKFARKYKVSATMGTYSLYRNSKIEYSLWRSLSNSFRQDFLNNQKISREKSRKESDGPDYYKVRRQRIGDALIHFVSSSLSIGDMTSTKAGKVLGINPKNVEHLIRLQTLTK